MTREQICASAAAALKAASPAAFPCTLGFDGFVDSIIEVVDKRHDAAHYDRVATIAEMARKISAAAGQSGNYELVPTLQKLGGNGPIMANALASVSFSVTYLGALGKPGIHSVFKDFASKATIYSLSEPAYTDALEFTDGKLMLGKLTSLGEITYENLLASVGREKLLALFSQSSLIGTVNWTMLPHLTALWKQLQAQIMPQLPKQRRILFIDLADPEKRTVADLLEALRTLAEFRDFARTILGLNLKESTQVAAALGIALEGDPQKLIAQTAARIREALQIACVVIHPRSGAAAADESGAASFAGPFTHAPRISTGAGDHFNAGFCMGQLLEMPLAESLCVGTATSGYFVRNAKSPTQNELVEFIQHLPRGE